MQSELAGGGGDDRVRRARWVCHLVDGVGGDAQVMEAETVWSVVYEDAHGKYRHVVGRIVSEDEHKLVVCDEHGTEVAVHKRRFHHSLPKLRAWAAMER